jgi:hypothetical protein
MTVLDRPTAPATVTTTPTIASAPARRVDEDVRADARPSADAGRELAVLVVTAVAASRLATPPIAWVVAALIGGASLVGASSNIREVVRARPGRGPDALSRLRGLAPGVVPGVIAGAGSLVVHAFPPTIELGLGLLALGLVLSWAVGLERRLALAPAAASDEDATLVLGLSVVTGFAGFVGVGTLVGAGLAGSSAATPIPASDLVVLVVADAVIAGLLGLRLARLRAATSRNAVLGGLSSGAIVAVAAGSLRALAVPFLLGPALLALVFFLWDALTGSTVARRRNARWAWELGLLVVLGVAVVTLNLRVG